MPVIDKHWENLTDEKWRHLAEQYLLEIRQGIGKEDQNDDHKWGRIVTTFGLWGPPELLWKFILLTVSIAKTEEELGAIAAGEVEYLLGRAGNEFIDAVEQEARTNPKFARTISQCLKYTMTDEVWLRVQKLKEFAEEKLQTDA